MATIVSLPKLGQTMEAGTIVEWLKNEGDPVARGEALFSVESDKAVLEVEARTAGVLRRILAAPGVTLPIGTPVAVIAAADEEIDETLREAAASASARPSGPQAQTPVPPSPPAPGADRGAGVRAEDAAGARAPGGRIIASPRARRAARRAGIDLSFVAGTGPNGRIVERDVLAHAAAQPRATPLARRMAAEAGVPLTDLSTDGGRVTAGQVRAAAPSPDKRDEGWGEGGVVTPLSRLRTIIAERMATSAHTAAAVTLQTVVDATELVSLRERLKAALSAELGFDLGYNDLLAYIVTRGLVEFPYMNARLEADGIRRLPEVHLGLAVDTDRGLLVPVLRDAQALGLRELATRLRELVARAREGQVGPDDLTGGTFTITNLGMYGVDAFTPIINLPECAILGVGRIRQEPAVVDGALAVRSRMWLSLTFDHRLVDGAPAARYLQSLARYVETPMLLLA